MTFGPGGLLATTGGPDHTIRLWDVRRLLKVRADIVQAACARAGRGLNPQEWSHFLPDDPYRDTCSSTSRPR